MNPIIVDNIGCPTNALRDILQAPGLNTAFAQAVAMAVSEGNDLADLVLCAVAHSARPGQVLTSAVSRDWARENLELSPPMNEKLKARCGDGRMWLLVKAHGQGTWLCEWVDLRDLKINALAVMGGN